MNTLTPMARAAALFIAVSALYGLGLQLYVASGQMALKGQTVADALWFIVAFFTVLTNLLVAVICLVAATDAQGFLARHATRTGGAVYILVVMAIYEILLRKLWSPAGAQWWADLLMHNAVPVLYVLWWLVCEPKGGLRIRHAFLWLLYPLAYLAYALIRAHFDGLYPYPFIDVTKLGYAGVAQSSAMMLVLFVAVGLAFVALDRMLMRRVSA